jgi:hypothetical protein
VDDSFGFLVDRVEQRWLPTLFEAHNHPEASFHLKVLDVIIMAKDLNPSDDIVYMNMTSLLYQCKLVAQHRCRMAHPVKERRPCHI